MEMETVIIDNVGKNRIDPRWKFVRSSKTEACVTTKSIFIYSWFCLLNKLGIPFGKTSTIYSDSSQKLFEVNENHLSKIAAIIRRVN